MQNGSRDDKNWLSHIPPAANCLPLEPRDEQPAPSDLETGFKGAGWLGAQGLVERSFEQLPVRAVRGTKEQKPGTESPRIGARGGCYLRHIGLICGRA